MTRPKTLFALLVVTLVAALAAPATAAADPEAQRQQVRAKKAQLAAQLDTLRASQADLDRALRVLDQQVVAQSRITTAARQAAAVADAEYAAASKRLEETKASLAKTTKLVVDHAVAEYISPRSASLDLGGDTTDLADKARREALLDSVNASTADVIDQLAAAREDYDLQTKEARDLRDKALEKKAQTEASLAALTKARADQERIAAGARRRMEDVRREIAAQAAADAKLTALINSRGSVGGDSSARSTGCIWPARGTVTSEYGSRWGRLHAGIDIANSIGTPIWASKAGTVIFAGVESGYGNTVIVDHGNGFSTLYAHMSRIGTSQGARVGQGQTVGAMGNTGHSTGPHVHFETRYNGSPRNPRSCLS
jgi:murein DD-endopeptidase MepM/ murein hydrolase activator NlpD